MNAPQLPHPEWTWPIDAEKNPLRFGDLSPADRVIALERSMHRRLQAAKEAAADLAEEVSADLPGFDRHARVRPFAAWPLSSTGEET